MEWTKRRIRTLIVLGVILGAIAVPVYAAVFDNTVEQSGSISYVAPNGPNATVVGDTNVSLNDPSEVFPFSNTVEMTTEAGNFTAISNGPTNFSIKTGEITGTYTNISEVDAASNELTVNPEDKVKLTLDGDADMASWTDYAIDDGDVDLVIGNATGGSTEVTFYELTNDLTITAVNKTNGKPLDVATTDSNGQVTFNISHSTQTILLQSGDQSSFPVLSNPSPTGDLSQEPTQLSIDVNDSDFPDDEVDVTIDLDGSQQTQTTRTSNGTVTTPISSLESGVHTWTVNATDKFGNSQVESYEFTVPGNVYIFNETENATGQHELLDGKNISVEATTTGSDDTAFKTNVNDGVIDLTGLPPDETFIITLDTDDFYVRSVYLPNLYDQNSVFLLNNSLPSTENTVSLEDRTGNFDDNPVLLTQRVINTSNVTNTSNNGYQWVTIGGDRMGADEQFLAHFEKDERYRFVVINTEGDRRVLGEYTAELDGPIALQIGKIDYQFGNGTGYEWSTSIENETTGGSITFAYNDNTNLTSEVRLVIKNRETGTVITNERFTNGPFGEVVYVESISQDQYENESWIVEWEADRDGETISADRVVGSQQPLEFPIDEKWSEIIYGLITLLLAFVVGVGISPGAGAVTVASWTGVAWYIELVPPELGAGAVVMAFLVAAWTTVQEQDPGVPT